VVTVKKIIKDEKGASMPLVAIILGLFALAFIALVVDVGTLYVERKKMVTSADAAALAGAQVIRTNKLEEKPKGDSIIFPEAQAIAEKYAIANGADPKQIKVFVGYKSVLLPDGKTESRQVVEVTVGKNKDLIFARFLGDDDTDVKANAVATWGYVKKSCYFPIFIFDTSYELNKNITLHDNVSLDGPKTNSYGFVQVNNNPGMSDIKLAIEGKISVPPKSVGDILEGVAGKRESVYKSAVTRIGDIVIIPIIDSVGFENNPANDAKNAKKWQLPVKYFAYFKITDVIKQNVQGNKSVQIKGQFTGKIIDKINDVEDSDQSNPNTDPDGDAPATYSRLIK